MAQDYYQVLGVDRGADARTIKKAYRKIALANHPDQNPGDSEAEARFRAASQAYSVLSDDEKRSLYDRYGEDGLNAQGGMGGVDLNDIFSGFGDIFDGMFGGRQSAPRRGADMRIRVPVTWDQVVNGATRTIKVPRHESCDPCSGSGSATQAPPSTCPHCGGSGQRAARQGFFVMSTPCSHCGGRGAIIADPCGDCDGSGRQRAEATVTIEIPAGVEQGMQMQLRGEGEFGGAGLPRGDLLVLFLVADPPEGWERDGKDLHRLLPVSLPDAVLGTSRREPGLHGEVKVKIPAGARDGDTVTLRGEGLDGVSGGRRGTLVYHINLEVPTKLNRAQRKAWEKLRDL